MRRTAIRLVLLFSVVSTGAIVFQNCAKKSGDFVVQSSSGTRPAGSGLSTDAVDFTDSNAENGSSFYTDFTSVEGSEKRCGVSFATFGQSVYEPSQSIGVRIKTSFPIQSNYVIEWASGDGDSPQGYDKSSELSSLKSAMSGLEAFTYLDFKVSYSLPGTYQRILRIKDASGNKLCDSNGSSPLIVTISPNKCDLGLTAASFLKGTDVSFTLKSSASLPTDFSVRWTDNKNNSVGEDSSLGSDISSQRENLSSGITLIRQFSELKTFTRAIEIKSGNNIWCISNPKEFLITEPVSLPTGGTAGTGSGSGSGSTGGSGSGSGGGTTPPVVDVTCNDNWISIYPKWDASINCTEDDANKMGADPNSPCFKAIKSPAGQKAGTFVLGQWGQHSDDNYFFAYKLKCGTDGHWNLEDFRPVGRQFGRWPEYCTYGVKGAEYGMDSTKPYFNTDVHGHNCQPMRDATPNFTVSCASKSLTMTMKDSSWQDKSCTVQLPKGGNSAVIHVFCDAGEDSYVNSDNDRVYSALIGKGTYMCVNNEWTQIGTSPLGTSPPDCYEPGLRDERRGLVNHSVYNGTYSTGFGGIQPRGNYYCLGSGQTTGIELVP